MKSRGSRVGSDCATVGHNSLYARDTHDSVGSLDRQRPGGQDRSAMWFSKFVTIVLLLLTSCSAALAQSFKKEFEAPEKVSLSVRNLDGRVSVVASEEQQKKVTVEARSAGAAIDLEDVKVESKGADFQIDVRPRGEKDRI